jgi:hypothetical protein
MNNQTKSTWNYFILAKICIVLCLPASGQIAEKPNHGFNVHPLAEVPAMVAGDPKPGIRVRQTEPEYIGTDVHHSLFLPADFEISKKTPLIVEFTGNYYPPSGSSGEVAGANFGFSATLGKKFAWIVLPFVSKDGKHNEKRWWGDEKATVNYAKSCVGRAIKTYNIDADRIVLCGFSRGAIAVGYIGLFDGEIAGLWSAFMTHDHFDGEREWENTDWGTPLAQYRRNAAVRLRRLRGRPFWVSQNDSTKGIEDFLRTENLMNTARFQFEAVPVKKILPFIPNDIIRHSHTDKWPLFRSMEADRLRAWLANI